MKDRIGIIGGGLVGALLSILLVKRGFRVEVFEKRSDPRKGLNPEGRSINLALSHRGIRALKLADVFQHVEPMLIPMYGRMIHTEMETAFHSYGRSDQFINSVSRHQLNTILIDFAEKSGASYHFDQVIQGTDASTGVIKLPSGTSHQFDFIIGADGAFSELRKTIGQLNATYSTTEDILSHGYKELNIPPKNGEFALDPHALHIWPRKDYMLIALPNNDKSFTCTLFLANEGPISFSQLTSSHQIQKFLEDSFPDAVKLLPDPIDQFQKNPTSSLQNIKTYPWTFRKSLLIGDAAHAIVPFYGQGMNAGFEDCRILIELLESTGLNWEKSVNQFQVERKKDTDAIAELALKNFLEMRNDVIDEDFLKRKRLEGRLYEAFPNEWLPLYSMVTFSDIPYHKALETGILQMKAIQSLEADYDPEEVNLKELLKHFKKLSQAAY
ncbi:MAG: FAD-dependent monooxygenase [Cyclobacteriaceae bacterium]|nr:FAD-dependent monooxygenase [Cyclobacteriaceae bacterium SS2]